jgi:hypothetical protein
MLAIHCQMVTSCGQTVTTLVSSLVVVGYQLTTYNWPRGHEAAAIGPRPVVRGQGQAYS